MQVHKMLRSRSYGNKFTFIESDVHVNRVTQFKWVGGLTCKLWRECENQVRSQETAKWHPARWSMPPHSAPPTRGLHSFPFPLDLSLLCPFPLK